MRKAKKFIINAVILTATSLIMRTLGVSFSIYISKKIGAEGMGIFQLLSSVFMFAITLATSGIWLTTTRLVAEELACNAHGGVKSAVNQCMVYSLFFSLIAATLLFINAEFITERWIHSKISTVPIYALSFSLPFLSMSSVLSGYFTAVRRVLKSSSAQLFEQFIKIATSIYFVNLLMPKGLDYACLALVLGSTIAEFASFLYLFLLYNLDKKRYHNNTPADKNLTRRMLGISLPVALSSYIRSALITYKQIVIPIGLEKSGISCDLAIAQYGMIRGMVMPVLLFPSAFLSAFSSLLIPEIAESYIQKRSAHINYIITRIFKITLLFSICVSGILWSYADELSRILYKNLDAATFIRVLAPLITVMYLDSIVDSILKGLNEQVNVVGINILDSIISIALLSTLLPSYGIQGYIMVIFVSELLNGFLSIHRLTKATSFELNFFWWILIPTITIAIAILTTKMLVTTNLILSIASVIMIYLTILFLSGGITRRDFKV